VTFLAPRRKLARIISARAPLAAIRLFTGFTFRDRGGRPRGPGMSPGPGQPGCCVEDFLVAEEIIVLARKIFRNKKIFRYIA